MGGGIGWHLVSTVNRRKHGSIPWPPTNNERIMRMGDIIYGLIMAVIGALLHYLIFYEPLIHDCELHLLRSVECKLIAVPDNTPIRRE